MNVLEKSMSIVIVCSFISSYYAGISPRLIIRQRITAIAILVNILYLAVMDLSTIQTEVLSAFNLLNMVTCGFIWPRLIARMSIHNHLDQPVILMPKRRQYLIPWLIILAIWGAIIYFILSSSSFIIYAGDPDEISSYMSSLIGWLLFLSPVLALIILNMVHRNALCENGLLLNGKIWGWSNFHSYSWTKDFLDDEEVGALIDEHTICEVTLELKKNLFLWRKSFRFVLPYRQKEPASRILETHLQSKNN